MLTPLRKSFGGLHHRTASQPTKAPTPTYTSGSRSIGHAVAMSSAFTVGKTLLNSSAGIVTFAESDESILAPAGVMMPDRPR